MYDGPYVIHSEVRPNAYVVGNEDGDAIGVFNSRMLRPHREPKLKSAAEINMIEVAEDHETARTRTVYEFCRDLKKKVQINDQEGESAEMNTGKEPKKRLSEETESDDDSKADGNRNLKKRKKNGLIFERGMRHISHF